MKYLCYMPDRELMTDSEVVEADTGREAAERYFERKWSAIEGINECQVEVRPEDGVDHGPSLFMVECIPTPTFYAQPIRTE